MKRIVLILIVLIFGIGVASRFFHKPSPEEIVQPETITKLTGVAFPPLRIIETLHVEGGNSWKDYYWLKVDYCDTTQLDIFFARIDSVIATGDGRWMENATHDYTFTIDEYAVIYVGTQGLFISMERYLWE